MLKPHINNLFSFEPWTQGFKSHDDKYLNTVRARDDNVGRVGHPYANQTRTPATDTRNPHHSRQQLWNASYELLLHLMCVMITYTALLRLRLYLRVFPYAVYVAFFRSFSLTHRFSETTWTLKSRWSDTRLSETPFYPINRTRYYIFHSSFYKNY